MRYPEDIKERKEFKEFASLDKKYDPKIYPDTEDTWEDEEERPEAPYHKKDWRYGKQMRPELIPRPLSRSDSEKWAH